MLSGIGDERGLRPLGIPVVQHLPGVGRNFQNHLAFTCLWETHNRWPPDEVAAVVMFWPRSSEFDSPDFFACQEAISIGSQENIARFGLPPSCWTLHGALTYPKSRGVLALIGSAASGLSGWRCGPWQLQKFELTQTHALSGDWVGENSVSRCRPRRSCRPTRGGW
jgi:hypothetical protein